MAKQSQIDKEIARIEEEIHTLSFTRDTLVALKIKHAEPAAPKTPRKRTKKQPAEGSLL